MRKHSQSSIDSFLAKFKIASEDTICRVNQKTLHRSITIVDCTTKTRISWYDWFKNIESMNQVGWTSTALWSRRLSTYRLEKLTFKTKYRTSCRAARSPKSTILTRLWSSKCHIGRISGVWILSL